MFFTNLIVQRNYLFIIFDFNMLKKNNIRENKS